MSRINSIQNQNLSNNLKTNTKIDRANFNQLFHQQLNSDQKELKISAHAERRLNERNLYLDDFDKEKISESIDRASLKGANDALILYKDIVMIASVRNKTIITAMEQGNTNEDIITNVDSAIFVR